MTAKPWLENYQQGVPAEISLDRYQSLADLIDESFTKYSQQGAYSNFGVTLTYQACAKHIDNLAAWLQKSAKLQKGDRIAMMMPNLLQYPIATCAALKAGLVVVNTNPLYTPRELKHQLKDSGAKAIIIVESFAGVLEQCIEDTEVEHVILTRFGDMLPTIKGALINFVIKKIKKMVPAYNLSQAVKFKTALSEGAGLKFEQPDLQHDDIAILQYTGGTTGVAKGAMLTHKNILANVEQAYLWIRNIEVVHPEIIVTALPLYHVFAMTANFFTHMARGSQNLLITNPRDMPAFVKEIKNKKFVSMTGVNTLFNGLLNTPGFSEVDFSRFKLCLGGGMAVQRAVAERWKEVTGVPIIEAYGLTETSPAVCINPLDIEDYNGTIGLPVPSTEVKVISEEGEDIGLGNPGELCVRGPQVMKGYWQRPEETAKVIDADGWLKTGDMAIINEDGYVKLVDRKKDMILVSGFNVYPNEVEDVIAAHPGVLEVGVIGVEDAKRGEIVKAIIVKQSADLSEQDIKQHCKSNLTGYKCPRQIVFTDELPKTNVGKVLRRELREMFGG